MAEKEGKKKKKKDNSKREIVYRLFKSAEFQLKAPARSTVLPLVGLKVKKSPVCLALDELHERVGGFCERRMERNDREGHKKERAS